MKYHLYRCEMVYLTLPMFLSSTASKPHPRGLAYKAESLGLASASSNMLHWPFSSRDVETKGLVRMRGPSYSIVASGYGETPTPCPTGYGSKLRRLWALEHQSNLGKRTVITEPGRICLIKTQVIGVGPESWGRLVMGDAMMRCRCTPCLSANFRGADGRLLALNQEMMLRCSDGGMLGSDTCP